MAWHARLDLDYRTDAAGASGTPRTRLDFRHDGPLRILKSLHPEGDAVCHSVIVHPPGGIVGGDTLDVSIALAPGAHALVTTPGATRFYRSAGARAAQAVDARLAEGARLEWLPLETLVHSGALADNRLRFDLAPGAETMGWDCVALGLPAADAPFVAGDYRHDIALAAGGRPRWWERGRTAAADTALLDGPCGWAGRRALATLWFAAGTPLAADRRDALLDAAREIAAGHPLAATAGATAPQAEVVVVRVLAPRVEPAFELMSAIWKRWRAVAWALAPCPPRVWRT
ncbi:MAG: urease accessory protein UreD [Burkholderiaceae bacterium]